MNRCPFCRAPVDKEASLHMALRVKDWRFDRVKDVLMEVYFREDTYKLPGLREKLLSILKEIEALP